VLPGGGSVSVCLCFTPRVLPEAGPEEKCEGFVLGFMSLDDKVSYRSKAKGDYKIIVSLPVIYVQAAVYLASLYKQPCTSFLS